MNLEKLNREFDQYLDEKEVTDYFSESRVLNIKKKKVSIVKISMSLISFILVLLIGAKMVLPKEETIPSPEIVETCLSEGKEEQVPVLEEDSTIEFSELDGKLFLNGLTWGMKLEEVKAVLTEELIKIDNIERGYGYLEEITYKNDNFILVFDKDRLVEIQVNHVSKEWIEDWYSNYEGEKYAKKDSGSFENPNSIRVIFSRDGYQHMFVKQIPVHENNPEPYYILYYRLSYYLFDDEMNINVEKTRTVSLEEAEQTTIEEYYLDIIHKKIQADFGWYYYYNLPEEYIYTVYEVDHKLIVNVAFDTNLVPKAIIDSDTSIVELNEKISNAVTEEEITDLELELEKLITRKLKEADSLYHTHFGHYAVVFDEVASELYEFQIASYEMYLKRVGNGE